MIIDSLKPDQDLDLKIRFLVWSYNLDASFSFCTRSMILM